MKDARDFGDDGSGDEYKDQSAEEDSDEEASEGSESESMEEEDDSDEDDDSAAKPARRVNGKKEKKVKAGAANRAAIRALQGDGSREIIDGKQR
jgi:hypothetical protein